MTKLLLKAVLSTSSCLKNRTVFSKYSVSVSRHGIDLAQVPCFPNSCFQKESQDSLDPGLQVRFGQYSSISFYRGLQLVWSIQQLIVYTYGIHISYMTYEMGPSLELSMGRVKTVVLTTAIFWKVAPMLLLFIIGPESMNNPLVNFSFVVF